MHRAKDPLPSAAPLTPAPQAAKPKKRIHHAAEKRAVARVVLVRGDIAVSPLTAVPTVIRLSDCPGAPHHAAVCGTIHALYWAVAILHQLDGLNVRAAQPLLPDLCGFVRPVAAPVVVPASYLAFRSTALLLLTNKIGAGDVDVTEANPF